MASVAVSLVACAAPCIAIPTFVRWWISALQQSAAACAVVGKDFGSTDAIAGARILANVNAPWTIIGVTWAGACAGAIAAAFACGSAGWTPGALRVRWSRLSPAVGLKALAGGTNGSMWLTLGAVLAVALAAVPSVRFEIGDASHVVSAGDQPAHLATLLAGFWFRASVAVAAIAAVDVILARLYHARRLRMTIKEVRDERIEQEGRPEVKARRRSIGLRRNRRLQIAAIKRAAAVVANPTHVAVALRYAPPLIDVPLVCAAGAGAGASIVRAAATLHGVPVIESAELARALFARVDVDEPIPEDLYAAVAAIFARIIRMRGSLGGVDGS